MTISDTWKETADTDPAAGAELQAKVDSLRGSTCSACQAQLCGHELLFAIAMGYGRMPQCLTCLSRTIGQTRMQLRDHLAAHFEHRHCYAVVWRHESEVEQMDDVTRPACLWPAFHSQDAASPSSGDPMDSDLLPARPSLPADAEWNAGGLSCGDLLLLLRATMNKLAPRTVLRLVATDAGAVEDIPAWCRLTGHRLLWAQHPEFFIQRKD